jgi:hypothetical protein
MPSAGDYANMAEILMQENALGTVSDCMKVATVLVDNGVLTSQAFALVTPCELEGFDSLTGIAQTGLSRILLKHTAKFNIEANVQQSGVRSGCFVATGGVVAANAVLDILNDMHLRQISVASLGPRDTINAMSMVLLDASAAAEWAEQARMEELCASSSRSLTTAMSAVRRWQAFVTTVLRIPLGKELPPTTDALVAWSRLFRNQGTYGNYLSGIKLACHVAGVPLAAIYSSAVSRAKRGVAALAPDSKPRRHIRRDLLARLVKLVDDEGVCREGIIYIS